jgi:hypothetical protein
LWVVSVVVVVEGAAWVVCCEVVVELELGMPGWPVVVVELELLPAAAFWSVVVVVLELELDGIFWSVVVVVLELGAALGPVVVVELELEPGAMVWSVVVVELEVWAFRPVEAANDSRVEATRAGMRRFFIGTVTVRVITL